MKNDSREQVLSLPVLLPPLAEQHRIVAKVDELMALCDRLETQQQSAEAAHAQLVQAVLDNLIQARDAHDFRASWHRLAKQFHLLFNSEASVEGLMLALQQLAVQGKLTSQRPEDGSAADLLEVIQARKSQGATLARASKISARSEKRDINEPHTLRANWQWTTAENVCIEIVDCPHSTPKFVATGVLCLDTNSIKQGRILAARSRFVDEATYEERIARMAPQAGDVVFAREGSVGESVVVPDGVRCCLGQRVMLFRPCQVLPHYLRLALSEPSGLARQLALHRGIGAKHVNVADMRQALIPLPPLAEQVRIVTKLAEILALCEQVKGQISAARAMQTHLSEVLVEFAVA
jgi:type I restriction enzyme S subunit